MHQLLEYCQQKLSRFGDYTDFNGKATKNGLNIWDSYKTITIPWEEIEPDIKDLFFGLCDDDQFIDFNNYAI